MQYLGGKSRIAKEIAAVIAPKGLWWEPFCGGLSVSVQLAKYGPGLVSDACLPLISLYRAVRDGWVPPTSVSESEYHDARSLPDSNPLKAFVGFGCSFGGKWFGGYASPDAGRMVLGKRFSRDAAGACARSLARDIGALSKCQLAAQSFFDVSPLSGPAPECIYADPPYVGATGYSATRAFDHDRFWSLCQAWADSGVRVFVSEYDCPVLSSVVWSKTHRSSVSGGNSDLRTERLFQVRPVAKELAA